MLYVIHKINNSFFSVWIQLKKKYCNNNLFLNLKILRKLKIMVQSFISHKCPYIKNKN